MDIYASKYTRKQLEQAVDAQKDKWDGEHGQFTIRSKFLSINGGISNGGSNCGITPLLALNRDYPIVLNNVLARNNGVAVHFFDAEGKFISYPEAIKDLNGNYTIETADFPENAVFFRVGTEKDGSSYSNGTTQEAREGVISNALITRLDKSTYDAEHEQFWLSGYYSNSTDGHFEYNTGYGVSDYIPLNHKSPIKVKGYGTTGVAMIAYFDARKNYISCVAYTEQSQNVETTVSTYPPDAAFFRVSAWNGAERYYKHGETVELRAGGVSDAIERSSVALFNALWLRCYDCQYDPTETKPYVCNGVKLTLAEAMDVYNAPRLTYDQTVGFAALAGHPKTIILGSEGTISGFADLTGLFRTVDLQGVRISGDTSFVDFDNASYAFYGCMYLKQILGRLRQGAGANVTEMFGGCYSLEHVDIHNLNTSISFASCPYLDEDSIVGMIRHAANTSPITITLHADPYLALTSGIDSDLEDYTENLLTGSDTVVENGDYLMHSYPLAEGPAEGEKMTITIWGELAEGKTNFVAYNSDGVTGLGGFTKIADGVYQCVCNWAITHPGGSMSPNTNLLIYASDSNQTGVSKINKIKLERGKTTSPVWSPALSEITDTQRRDQARRANIINSAALRQISLAMPS